MFDEVKEKILLSDYIQGNKKINGKRIRVNPCPLCGGHDCFDILAPGKGNNTHEIFNCKQCNQSGSIIDFYCLSENLNPKNKEDISKAINELCKTYEIDNGIKGQEQTRKASQSLTEPHKAIKENKKEYDFTELANKLHENLMNNEYAKQYFIDRGLSEDVIKEFKLGFAAGGFNNAFKDYSEFKQKYEPLAECYRFFIPMFDDKGKCRYILSRVDNTLLELKIKNAELHKHDRQGKENKYPKTMNLKGVPTTIYNLDQAMKSEIIYICEGWCDALSIEESGYKAIALNSVSSVNLFIKKLQEYKNYQSKFYVIALDNDEAGNKARKELEAKLLELKCKVKHLYIEESGSKDVNDLLINAKEILYEKMSYLILKTENKYGSDISLSLPLTNNQTQPFSDPLNELSKLLKTYSEKEGEVKKMIYDSLSRNEALQNDLNSFIIYNTSHYPDMMNYDIINKSFKLSENYHTLSRLFAYSKDISRLSSSVDKTKNILYDIYSFDINSISMMTQFLNQVIHNKTK